MLPHHFIALHWRAVLAAAVLALLVWACLPAVLKAKLSAGWKKFGHFLGNVNARIILTLLYASVMAIFGMPVRLFADVLHTKKRPEAWFAHPPTANTLEEARRQG